MAFNMSSYQSAASTDEDIRKTETEANKVAAEKQAKTQEFKLDKTVEFKNKAAKAQKTFGNWKSGLGLLGGIIGMATGLGPLAMAAVSAGSTLVGGKIGKHNAEIEMGGRWFKGNQRSAVDSMEKSIWQDTIMSGIMGAVAGSGEKLATGAKGTHQSLLKGAGGKFKGSQLANMGTNVGRGFKALGGKMGDIGVGKTILDQVGITDQDPDPYGLQGL